VARWWTSLGLLGLLGCNLADAVLLWPPSGPLAGAPASRREVMSNGAPVEIWVVGPAHPEAYVLTFYGNADRADWHVPNHAAQLPNAQIWGVNYPGYGGSAGPATLRGVVAAAEAAYDDLAKHAAGEPIFAFGESLGTTAALHLAATRKIDGLVLVNPPPLEQLVLGKFGWWNMWLVAFPVANQIPRDLDSLHNASLCSMPAVFVTAENDDVVPPAYQRRIMSAYAGPKEIIVVPGGTHNSGVSSETEQHILAAVKRMMSRR
jgi:hypothetical protein